MSEQVADPPWRQRIGGRWAISWQAFVAGASINTLIVGLTGGQIGATSVRPADIPAWLGIGLLASAAAGIWALIADASFMRDRRTVTVPAWMVIGFHLGIGLAFGSVIVFAGDALVSASAQPVAERLAVIALIGLWWGITASLVLEARDRFNRQRLHLVDVAVQLELTAISEADTAMRLREAIENDMEPALGGVRAEVDEVLTGLQAPARAMLPIDEWWRISAALRDTAEATVRPLSHQLWEATQNQYPAPRLGRVLSRAVLYQQFAPVPSMIILAIGYLPAGAYSLGLGLGLISALAMAVGMGGILLLANLAMRRAPRMHALLLALAVIASCAWSAAYLALVDAWSGVPFALSAEVLGGVVATALSVLFPAAFSSLDDLREDVLQRFRLDTDHARIAQFASAQQLAIATRAAARDLHGTLQTRLISCAVAIEHASASGDIEQFRSALETSIAILDAPLPNLEADTSATVLMEIARMCAPWEGLCEFEVRADDEAAALRGPVAMAAGRVIEEAVANACRHGLATAVVIEAAMIDGPALRLCVDDDGTGPTGGAPGLGAAMLAGISGGRVSLDSGPAGGARLTVELPIDA